MVLSESVDHWAEHGFVVAPELLTADDLRPALAELGTMFPSADEYHDGADEPRNAGYRGDEYAGLRVFPFESIELSLLAVHPRLVGFAEQLLGTEDIRLYAAEAWAKFCGAASYEQELHRDYLNHTPLVPTDDPRFGQVEMFLYLEDVEEGQGPPHVVSRTLTRSEPGMPHCHSRADRPELYAAEVSGAGPAGTVVAYGVDTFHRATAITGERGARYTLHLNLRTGEATWVGRHAWGDRSFDPGWTPFINRASVRQLLLFGFPPPGHAYWTDETLDAMARRYPELDLTPWRA